MNDTNEAGQKVRLERIVGRTFSAEAYKAAGCFQFEVPWLAMALHIHTQGRMCNGCPKNDGYCRSLQALMRDDAKPKLPTAPQETVREEAARLGISISEVRRRRSAPNNRLTGA